MVEGVGIGGTITNVTDGSSGTVTLISSNNQIVHTALSGGSDNQWEVGDVWQASAPVDKGFEFAHMNFFDVKWGRG
jgi:hypothetical protein